MNTDIWRDEKFAEFNKTEKLLTLYLISNQYLGLTRYAKIPDRTILFDTGLTKNEIAEAKQSLQEKWQAFVFWGDWVYINNDWSYCDYSGGKTSKAKEQELSSVPKEILSLVENIGQRLPNDCPSIGLINNKLKIINNNTGVVKGRKIKHPYNKEEVNDQVCKEIADKYEVSLRAVLDKRDDLEFYCGKKGEQYADYKLTLMDWVRTDIKKGLIKKEKPPEPDKYANIEISEEQRLKNLQHLAEIKARLVANGKH